MQGFLLAVVEETEIMYLKIYRHIHCRTKLYFNFKVYW